MKTTIQQSIPVVLGIVLFAFLPLFEYQEQAQALGEEAPNMLTEYLAGTPDSVFAISSPKNPERVVNTLNVVVTAYSSTPGQTDDTPFITASGTIVRDGIVAANFLPIGTKIKLPDIYGDRVFVVEDRMHPRKQWMVDVWFPTYLQAKEFGAKRTYIEVLES